MNVRRDASFSLFFVVCKRIRRLEVLLMIGFILGFSWFGVDVSRWSPSHQRVLTTIEHKTNCWEDVTSRVFPLAYCFSYWSNFNYLPLSGNRTLHFSQLHCQVPTFVPYMVFDSLCRIESCNFHMALMPVDEGVLVGSRETSLLGVLHSDSDQGRSAIRFYSFSYCEEMFREECTFVIGWYFPRSCLLWATVFPSSGRT